MILPMAGFTIAVTAARRAEELGLLFERRGAKVVYAPAVQIVPVVDDAELSAATKTCLAEPPDILVATTGIGFRGWMEAADEWGLVEDLNTVLADVEIVARGPKATGAIRAAGFSEVWSPDSESSHEVLGWLLNRGVKGKTIAVQLHGHPLPEFIEPLKQHGATIVEISPYRWLPPSDVTPVHKLLESVVARQVDAVTFTSAPAALVFLEAAREQGIDGAVNRALQSDVQVVCVGPITADVLHRVSIPTIQPERSRLGALARQAMSAVAARTEFVATAQGILEVRGSAAVFDSELRPLAPGSMAVLRALIREPGAVIGRTELAEMLAGGVGNDDHAVDVAIARLRSGLGDARLVQTVVRRGYRLAVMASQPEFAGK